MSCCHQVHNDFLGLNISSFLCSTVDKMRVWDSVFIYILDSVFNDWFMSLLLSFLCYFPFPRSEIQLIQNFMSNNLPAHVLRANQPLILALSSMFCLHLFQVVCPKISIYYLLTLLYHHQKHLDSGVQSPPPTFTWDFAQWRHLSSEWCCQENVQWCV